MIIPKYWGKAEVDATKPDGQVIPLAKWYWSNESVADAEAKAQQRLQATVARVAAGHPFPQRYAYTEDQPMREEVLREVVPGSAVITRNAYGAQVLNADRVMFVDIDFGGSDNQPPGGKGVLGQVIEVFTTPSPSQGAQPGPGIFERLLGIFTNPQPTAPQPFRGDPEIRFVEDWVARNPTWSFRVYSTASGLRLLATHQTFSPDAPETLNSMRQLGCDPLYLKLCSTQKSFRARLTPKPWRIGMRAPDVRFPYEGVQANSIRQWISQYENASSGRATCHFVKSIGPESVHPDVQPILGIHDDMTKAQQTTLSLA